MAGGTPFSNEISTTHSLLFFNDYGLVPSPRAPLAHCCRSEEAQDWSARLLQGKATPSPAALQELWPSQQQLMGHGLPSQPGQQVVGRQHCHGAPCGIRGTPDVWQNHCRGQGQLLACFLPSLTAHSLFQGSSHGGKRRHGAWERHLINGSQILFRTPRPKTVSQEWVLLSAFRLGTCLPARTQRWW